MAVVKKMSEFVGSAIISSHHAKEWEKKNLYLSVKSCVYHNFHGENISGTRRNFSDVNKKVIAGSD